MIKAYPIILTPDTGGYVVSVPDLEINTQGDDLAEALYMARNAIGEWGICQQDSGRAIPEPSKSEPPHEASELVSWIDIDFDKYRRASDMTYERTNITLPRYLKSLASDAGLNLSQELQTRLKEVLRVTD
ncbi:MAG: type II toxin-antitoxin system HicB family antitoxin [Syntrophomonadaceae bacterium]|jgi:predicted RNase H-like HicB family nuclease|nr:type II toxin-antitoxin system HicB family antitoxin [Syntrophomonadaceae bacterium]